MNKGLRASTKAYSMLSLPGIPWWQTDLYLLYSLSGPSRQLASCRREQWEGIHFYLMWEDSNKLLIVRKKRQSKFRPSSFACFGCEFFYALILVCSPSSVEWSCNRFNFSFQEVVLKKSLVWYVFWVLKARSGRFSLSKSGSVPMPELQRKVGGKCNAFSGVNHHYLAIVNYLLSMGNYSLTDLPRLEKLTMT